MDIYFNTNFCKLQFSNVIARKLIIQCSSVNIINLPNGLENLEINNYGCILSESVNLLLINKVVMMKSNGLIEIILKTKYPTTYLLSNINCIEYEITLDSESIIFNKCNIESMFLETGTHRIFVNIFNPKLMKKTTIDNINNFITYKFI